MRRDRRLTDILEAGARVLAERGVHGTTMRRVAREARTSLANLYHYVGGREDLVYRVHLRVLEAAVASAQAAMGARGARDRLRALVTDHVRRVLARPAEAEVLRAGPGILRGERARRLDELRRRYASLVRLAADNASGVRAPKARESELRAQLLLGMADRVALDAALSRPGSSPQRLAAPVLRLFLALAGKRRALVP